MAFICYLREQDSFEFLSTQIFWVLGLFLAFNGYWANQQVVRFSELEEQADSTSPSDPKQLSDSDLSSTPLVADDPLDKDYDVAQTSSDSRYGLFWLQPHLTSRVRQALAVVTCAFIIPLQFIEGWWILQTAWRVTLATHYATWWSGVSFFFRGIVYLPGLAIGVVAWGVVLWTGAFLVLVQFTYLLQLLSLKPGSTVQLGRQVKTSRSEQSVGN